MSEDYYKFLCEKAGYSKYFPMPVNSDEWLTVLIRAMWAINNDKVWKIDMMNNLILIYKGDFLENKSHKTFDYQLGKQQALEAALKYIWEQTK